MCCQLLPPPPDQPLGNGQTLQRLCLCEYGLVKNHL